jgi:hypothetical protein
VASGRWLYIAHRGPLPVEVRAHGLSAWLSWEITMGSGVADDLRDRRMVWLRDETNGDVAERGAADVGICE